MTTTVVLDSEAVHALGQPSSKKHRATLRLVEFERGRHRRDASGRLLVVPSTVRVEAGWDRTAPRWAGINRLRIIDHHLDQRSTDTAARLRAEHGVSPADAHIGALAHERAQDEDDRVVVVTSDPGDIAAVIAGTDARIVPL